MYVYTLPSLCRHQPVRRLFGKGPLDRVYRLLRIVVADNACRNGVGLYLGNTTPLFNMNWFIHGEQAVIFGSE